MMRRAPLASLAAALLLAACASPPASLPPMPEGASGFTAKPGWHAKRHAVAAANPLAAQAGLEVLDAGGSAIDAAVAVQMVLTLVEPQSSGIGGGAFLLHWDGRRVQAFDGRESAPAAAGEGLFLRNDGTPLPQSQAAVGGLAVGVPGAVAMLEAAHRQHGRLPWARLFDGAIRLAENGFAVSPRMHTMLAAESALKTDPRAVAYFYGADGRPHPVGHRLKNPALAAALRELAAQGAEALRRGPLAGDIVARVRLHPARPGLLSAQDLIDYRAVEREPLCADWQRWRVCGMPPPSSGQLALMQILGMLEQLPAAKSPLDGGLPDAGWLHQYTEAARLAFADRALYVADPDFVAPPAGGWRSLLDRGYLRDRAAIIGERSIGTAPPGQPGGKLGAWAPQAAQAESGTSHISIVDGDGRAVAMTTSIEAAWGSRLLSDGGSGLPGGFLLNNQLTDFSLSPRDAQGRPVANRVQPGKRPRSSMSPTLVFDRSDGSLVMTLGSPGGAAIIHFVAKTLIAALDWGLPVQRSIDLPNFGSFNGPTVLERGRFPAATISALAARGHTVAESELTSGVQAIVRARGGGWDGGADPRREGVMAGR